MAFDGGYIVTVLDQGITRSKKYRNCRKYIFFFLPFLFYAISYAHTLDIHTLCPGLSCNTANNLCTDVALYLEMAVMSF